MNWIKALRAGERLTHAATWKNVQVATNALVALITVIVSYFDLQGQITDETMLAVAGGIVAVVNIYFTNATSRKVGV